MLWGCFAGQCCQAFPDQASIKRDSLGSFSVCEGLRRQFWHCGCPNSISRPCCSKIWEIIEFSPVMVILHITWEQYKVPSQQWNFSSVSVYVSSLRRIFGERGPWDNIKSHSELNVWVIVLYFFGWHGPLSVWWETKAEFQLGKALWW